MEPLHLILFPEIEKDMSPGLKKFEEELLDHLRREKIRIDRYPSPRKPKERNRRKRYSVLSSIVQRHLVYPFRARSYFSPAAIHFVSNSGHAQILNFAPETCTKIIHCHDLVAFIPRRVLGYRWDHGGIIRHLWAFVAQSRAIRKADVLIAISENTKNDLIRYLRVPEERIRIVPNGVNHHTFRVRDRNEARETLGLEKPKTYILNVSSDEQRKNFPGLLQAFSLVLRAPHDACLIHVGGLSKKSRRMIEEMNLAPRIANFEHLSEEQLALLYNASDLFAFPSYYEGFGLPVLEAMASGCPVVASNRSSLPEVVGEAGILVDPENIQALGNAMHRVLADTPLRNDLIRRGLEQAKNFSWEKCAQQIHAICKDSDRRRASLSGKSI